MITTYTPEPVMVIIDVQARPRSAALRPVPQADVPRVDACSRKSSVCPPAHTPSLKRSARCVQMREASRSPRSPAAALRTRAA